jgi:hypothetical protein
LGPGAVALAAACAVQTASNEHSGFNDDTGDTLCLVWGDVR